MNPVSPVPAIAALVAAIATAFFLSRRFGAPLNEGRFTSIDGLRGYLAFFVFLHHSCIWYFYLRTDQWGTPPSNLYTQFGESSVSLFFMITSFLFFTKIIEGRRKRIDWMRLYISRVLRLLPLYLFVIFILVSTVIFLSNGTLREPPLQILKEVIRWLSFTISGGPNINEVSNTFAIVAGVTWSLPYEWFFYLCLPLFALLVRTQTPFPYLLIGFIGAFGLIIWHIISHQNIHHLLSFGGGIVAAFLVRNSFFVAFANKKLASAILLLCLLLLVDNYPSGFSTGPLILLSIVFALIAGGNSIFGLLHSDTSRTLGEISYSIYLLQGIILFFVFNFIIGLDYSRSMPPIVHWGWIVGITPIFISTCFFTFRFIEQPAMQSTHSTTERLRALLNQKATQ